VAQNSFCPTRESTIAVYKQLRRKPVRSFCGNLLNRLAHSSQAWGIIATRHYKHVTSRNSNYNLAIHFQLFVRPKLFKQDQTGLIRTVGGEHVEPVIAVSFEFWKKLAQIVAGQSPQVRHL
jgi:hypothetical protein